MSSKIWLKSERKVFLSNFKDTLMVKDAQGKYATVKDFWRKKTYIKDHDKFLPSHEREFSEPYQVAQHYCGGTWNDYNTPFTIQIGSCNLDCFWCFVSEDLKKGVKGKYFSTSEVIDMWVNEVNQGVLRVSGGEPFLAPDFLIELGTEIKKLDKKNLFLWIDTNLLGFEYERVSKHLSNLNIPFGICGCFKGFDEETFEYNTKKSRELFKNQFKNAKSILHNLQNKGELFFYVPEILQEFDETQIEQKLNNFINLLTKHIHQLAPLRVTVLAIKTYESNLVRMCSDRLETGFTRNKWFSMLKKKYSIDLMWLPQYQIKINK